MPLITSLIARFHWSVRLQRAERLVHTQLRARQGRGLVPGHRPLLPQPLPGLHSLHKLSYHHNHSEEQSESSLSDRRYIVFRVLSVILLKFHGVTLDISYVPLKTVPS